MRFISAFLIAGLLSIAAAAPSIYVAYPANNYKVASDHIILEGSVSGGSALSINGKKIDTAPDGLFMLWWPLKLGSNDIKLIAKQNDTSSKTNIRVYRTSDGIMPTTPTAIDRSSISPAENIELWDASNESPEGRQVVIGFNGSPGGKAFFKIGNSAPLPMREISGGSYSATYTFAEGISLPSSSVKVSLSGKDGNTSTVLANGKLSSSLGVVSTGVQKYGSIVGRAVNDAQNYITDITAKPVLFPRNGMIFKVVGKQGADYRIRLGSSLVAFASASQLDIQAEPPPLAVGGLISVENDDSSPNTSDLTPQNQDPLPTKPQSNVKIRIPLGARTPFVINQVSPSGLEVLLYNLTSPPTSPEALTDPLLRSISVAPKLSNSTVSIDLSSAQLWGFSADYEGTDLVVYIKKPPILTADVPLKGRVITIDAGHGGTQNGGAGSFGVPEKNLMLPIALRVAELLRLGGAMVNLTRSSDITLDLYSRVLSAEDTDSDMLISIHANALPDGKNPYGIRGPEVYFTHQQAQPLASSILEAIRLGIPEIGTGAGLKSPANLALTRPTAQISLLIETAYLTDPSNLRALSSPDGKEKFAQAIALGIENFYIKQVQGK